MGLQIGVDFAIDPHNGMKTTFTGITINTIAGVALMAGVDWGYTIVPHCASVRIQEEIARSMSQFKPGKYNVVYDGTSGTRTSSPNENEIVKKYPKNTILEIIKIANLISENRIRGQVSRSLDWVSIKNTANGFMWLEPILEKKKKQNVTHGYRNWELDGKEEETVRYTRDWEIESAGPPLAAGKRLVTKEELQSIKNDVLESMGQWDIVELANFWKIAGKGYGGKVERRDGSLGHRLVTKSKFYGSN